MIIQSEQEAANYTPLRGKRNTLVAAKLAQLEIGQALIIERKDWKTKTSPFRIVNAFARKHHRTFDKAYTNDGTGWWIKRLT